MKKREYLCIGPEDILNAVKAVDNLDPTKKWRVTIAPYVKNRTTDQNNLMWQWNTEIAKHTGHTPNEVHEHCKAMFSIPRRVTINGCTTEYRTTTEYNTAEMTEYLERVRAWAQTELGMTLSVYGE